MKVYELAREIGIPNKELIAKMQEMGIDVKSHLNVIDDQDVDKVRDIFSTDVSEVENEPVRVESKPEKWKPDLSRMIKIKNISPGYLIYKSKRQMGYVVEWPKNGDINHLELGEFMNLKNTNRRFITTPWIRIVEDDEIEILEYANILKYFKGIIGIENVTDILKLDFESFKVKFDNLPKGYKNTVAGHAAQMIKSGELDSIKIKNYIEQEMDTDLEFMVDKRKEEDKKE